MTYNDMKIQMYIAIYAAAVARGEPKDRASMLAEAAVGDATEYFKDEPVFDEPVQQPTEPA